MNTKQTGFIQRSLNLWDTLTGALDKAGGFGVHADAPV